VPIHKIILGGEQYLPFALSKLRQLAQHAERNGGFANQKIIVDGVTILLGVRQDQWFLTILGEEASYEFLTSEWIENFALYSELVDGFKVVKGSGTRMQVDTGRVRPVFSEGDSLPENAFTPDWPVRPVSQVLLGKYQEGNDGSFDEDAVSNVIGAPNFFKTWSFVNNQKFHEHVWWPGNSSRSFVTSTNGYGPGRANTGGLLHTITNLAFVDGTSAVDRGLDVPPVQWTLGRFKTGQPVMPTDHVWPRRGAVQTVTSEQYGTRDFFILTDTHGRFYVYPARNYFAQRQTTQWRALPEDMFKVYTPPYPAWVTEPDLSENVAWSHWTFTFNKDATKAVTVALNRDKTPTNWKLSPGAAGIYHVFAEITDPEALSYNAIRTWVPDGSEGPYLADTDGWWQMFHETPGLVEFNIAITITGPGEMDYEADITLGRSEYQEDNARFFVDAAYLLKPKAIPNAEAVMGAAEDTLVTAEIEVWWAPTMSRTRIGRESTVEATPPIGTNPAGHMAGQDGIEECQIFYVVRNYDTGEVLRKFCLSNTEDMTTFPKLTNVYTGVSERHNLDEYAISRVSQADLRSLSFLVVSYYYPSGNISNTNSLASLYVWNTLQHTASRTGDSASDAVMQSWRDADFPEYPFVKIPDTDTANTDVAKLHCEHAMLMYVKSYLGNPVVNVHPEGHWAFGAGDHTDLTDTNQTLDIIQRYTFDKTTDPPTWVAQPRTSHRSLFNEAFGQSRTPDYYTPTPDDDMGSFGLSGIWRILRKDRG